MTPEKKKAFDEMIAERERNAPKETPEPPATEVGMGLPNTNSSRTLEKLRGLSRTLSARLTDERNAHIVKITTFATELCDVQGETIQALEAHIVELEARIAELQNLVARLVGRDALPEAGEPAPLPCST
jgi:hypothetical protein